MSGQFNLNIKKPCSQNFNQFLETEKGGFCGSCQKEVIDFTKMNSGEIIDFFSNKEIGNTCGRFKASQLQFIYEPRKNRFWSYVSGFCLAFLSLIPFISAEAQSKLPRDKSLKNNSEIEESKSKRNITVKGQILAEDNLPLPGATILLEGKTVGTQTDFDGKFIFPEKLKIDDVLIVSYLGYNSQKIVIKNKDSATKIELKIDMKMDSCMILGEVAVKDVYKSKGN